jgi:arginine deiminase
VTNVISSSAVPIAGATSAPANSATCIPAHGYTWPTAPRAPEAVLRSAFTECSVDSEVGILERVLLHRPGPELERLLPENHRELLFDDIPWLAAAQAEHDAFSAVLKDHGVQVVELDSVLTAALELSVVRHLLIGFAAAETRLGRTAARALRDWLQDLVPAELSQRLLAGVTLAELPAHCRTALSSSLAARNQPADWFALRPLPNAMFVRDSLAWMGQRFTAGRMAHGARDAESRLALALVRAVREDDELLTGDEHSAPLEGGDILVAGNGCVVVGVGQRTSAAAAEALSRALLRERAADKVLAVTLPPDRNTMHLDTIMTMVDHDTLLVSTTHYRSCRWHRLVLDRSGEIRAQAVEDGFAALAHSLSVPAVRVIDTGEASFAARREQWSDSANVLALRPGLVIAYDRNTTANDRLDRAGIQVVPIPGSELARGRGGPHCLSCPLIRATTMGA